MHSSRIFVKTCSILLLIALCFNSIPAFGQDEFDEPGENVTKNFSRKILILSRQGEYPQAIRLAEQEVAKREKTYGLEDPYVAKAIQTLGTLHLQVGDYAKAEPLLQRTLDIRKNALGEEHLDFAETLNSMGQLLMVHIGLAWLIILFRYRCRSHGPKLQPSPGRIDG